jgi:hypothetical protein
MNWFKRKIKNVTQSKLSQIKRFDSKKEYIKLLVQLISDIDVDYINWMSSSFITSIGGSLSFVKGRINNPSIINTSKSEVQIRVEFGFSTTDGEFKCHKIELKIGGIDKLTIEDCNKIIGDKAIKILYDFYCREQKEENEKISTNFNIDKEIVNSVISKSTKRDDKLNKLGI